LALTAGGGITSAWGQLQSGKTNRDIERVNAQVARDKAEQAENAGAFAAAKTQIKGQQIQGVQRGAMAGQGTVAGAGTSGAVLQDTTEATGMDALMIQRNAAREAMGYQTAAMSDEMKGNAAYRAGQMGAISTLMNAGSQAWLESDPNYSGYRGRGVGLQ